MASTVNLQSTISWAAPFLRFMPNNSGPTQEPAITNANRILSTILGPPFKWRWNRGTAQFTASAAGGQDYVVSVSDFGFLEKAVVVDGSGNATEITDLKLCLSQDSSQGRPQVLAPQLDDNAGNITFRLQPGKPDATYTVKLTYQKKPVLMTSVASLWAPIPDEYGYIYEPGFLAMSLMFTDDPRFASENQKFVSHLLGAAEGLSEMEINMFLGNWLVTTGQVISNQLRAQQGNQARLV